MGHRWCIVRTQEGYRWRSGWTPENLLSIFRGALALRQEYLDRTSETSREPVRHRPTRNYLECTISAPNIQGGPAEHWQSSGKHWRNQVLLEYRRSTGGASMVLEPSTEGATMAKSQSSSLATFSSFKLPLCPFEIRLKSLGVWLMAIWWILGVPCDYVGSNRSGPLRGKLRSV